MKALDSCLFVAPKPVWICLPQLDIAAQVVPDRMMRSRRELEIVGAIYSPRRETQTRLQTFFARTYLRLFIRMRSR